MAANKISYEWNERGDGYIFTGSQRQPTLVEIHNFLLENHISLEGVYVVCARLGGSWWAPEECTSVELLEFNETCPVCGKPFKMDADICPICHKEWG